MSPESIVSNYIFRGADSLPNLALTPLMASIYLRFKDQFPNLDRFAYISHYIRYEDTMMILAKTKIGSEHMLKEFQCFKADIYYTMFFSLLVISWVSSVHKMSLRVFFATFWAYLSALLRQNHSYPDKTLFEKWMSCPWLIGCVILLGAFSGTLRGQILKRKDIHWIDSLRDLYEWKDITKLQYYEYGDFNNYLLNNDNDDSMRDYFKTKAKECYTHNIRPTIVDNCIQTSQLNYQGVRDGTTAMIFQTKYINLVKQEFFKSGWKEDLDYHVSKMDKISQPQFTITNKLNFDKVYEQAWDQS